MQEEFDEEHEEAKTNWSRRRSKSAFVGTHSLTSSDFTPNDSIRERHKVVHDLKHSISGSSLDPWSEESWQDRCNVDSGMREPPPMPRLPPCRKAPLGSHSCEDMEKRADGIDGFCGWR